MTNLDGEACHTQAYHLWHSVKDSFQPVYKAWKMGVFVSHVFCTHGVKFDDYVTNIDGIIFIEVIILTSVGSMC